ncbi:hypothetical protein [Psychromarinibacter sp. S121]|uniref:hypothetical protein n=1 Tax=Psychromarinibacter sp. S121 TaxID=3415127 RepID=UPI003C7EB618
MTEAICDTRLARPRQSILGRIRAWIRKPAKTEDPYAGLGALPPHLLSDIGFSALPEESTCQATTWTRDGVTVLHHNVLPGADAILFGR